MTVLGTEGLSWINIRLTLSLIYQKKTSKRRFAYSWINETVRCCFKYRKFGTACFAFRNYFQHFHHNSLNTTNNAKGAKLPKMKLDFAHRSFIF